MEELTKQEAIKLHRKMWKIISEMSDEDMGGSVNKDIKIPTLKKMGIEPESVSCYCFCCEYAIQQKMKCLKCPIKWKNNDYCVNGEYDLFCSAISNYNFTKARKMAKIISELPENEEVE